MPRGIYKIKFVFNSVLRLVKHSYGSELNCNAAFALDVHTVQKLGFHIAFNENVPLKALIFDSYYDNYKGVILFVRIKDGKIKAGDKIKTFRSDKVYEGFLLLYSLPKGR